MTIQGLLSREWTLPELLQDSLLLRPSPGLRPGPAASGAASLAPLGGSSEEHHRGHSSPTLPSLGGTRLNHSEGPPCPPSQNRDAAA